MTPLPLLLPSVPAGLRAGAASAAPAPAGAAASRRPPWPPPPRCPTRCTARFLSPIAPRVRHALSSPPGATAEIQRARARQVPLLLGRTSRVRPDRRLRVSPGGGRIDSRGGGGGAAAAAMAMGRASLARKRTQLIFAFYSSGEGEPRALYTWRTHGPAVGVAGLGRRAACRPPPTRATPHARWQALPGRAGQARPSRHACQDCILSHRERELIEIVVLEEEPVPAAGCAPCAARDAATLSARARTSRRAIARQMHFSMAISLLACAVTN